MDDVDIANDRIMADLENRLAAARSAVRSDGPEFCEADGCGEPMPDQRRRMGLRHCIECATMLEQQARQYRRR